MPRQPPSIMPVDERMPDMGTARLGAAPRQWESMLCAGGGMTERKPPSMAPPVRYTGACCAANCGEMRGGVVCGRGPGGASLARSLGVAGIDSG
eukprot:3200475-Rhodomonas_salina.1